jgi:tripartite-type tricarboxylate transporter receptor subunit TctC
MVRLVARRLIMGALLGAPLAMRAATATGPPRTTGWSPARPVRFVIAFPPGGSSDIAARWLARKLTPRLGQPVVVENRPGANGILGSQHVASSPPDGHTMILTTADTHSVNPLVCRRLPYTPQDFLPVAPVARLIFALVARRGLGAHDAQGFISAARRAPRPLTFSSWGVASTSQIMMETFRAEHGLDMQHVPFQGSASAVAALLAEQVDSMMAPVGVAIAQGGRVSILGVATAFRFPAAPEVATLTEQGIPLVGGLWVALLAPPGTSVAVAERMAVEVHAIISTAEAAAFLGANGLVPDTQDRMRFLDYLREEDAVWRARVERLGIRLDD